MDSDKHPEPVANKIKELHTNIRHITQLAMNWFAFFVTVNYLTMGWLAKRPSSGGESINPNIIWALALVFIVQNVLGVIGLIWVLVAATAMKNEVRRLEDEQKSKDIPTTLYIAIGVFLTIVLVSLVIAWVVIASGNS